MSLKHRIKTLANRFLRPFGSELIAYKPAKRDGLHLNVGCGNYEIAGFVSVDYYSDHYYRNKRFKRVHYDMRQDDLPYDSDSVDTIYCSHVVEHIERPYGLAFFREAHRVLKKGGVLRIACPDAAFLYQAWCHMPEFFNHHRLYKTLGDASQCFVSLLASHRADLPDFGLEKPIMDYDYDALLVALEAGAYFDAARPGQHICIWDFDLLNQAGTEAGFGKVVRSRHRGSAVPALQGSDMDATHPEMSLYVDFYKS